MAPQFMDISVIIPVYNGASTIAETLESILAQTLTPPKASVEIIVINDGSTDDTSAVVQQFMGRRPDYSLRLVEVENGGVSRARNRGAALANGRYLTFIDADDLWTTDKLEAQFFALEANPDAGFVYSWVNSIDLDSNFLRRGGYMTMTGDPWVQLLIVDVVESGSNVMVRRDAYEQVNGFDENLTHSEDWDLWIRLAERFGVVTVPMAQVLYRQGGVTASTNVRKMEQGSLQIIQRAAKRVGGTNHPVIRQSLANRYKILTFEAMDGTPRRGRAVQGLVFAAKAIFYDPQLLKVFFNPLLRFVLKCMVILVGPRRTVRAWLARRLDWAELENFFLASLKVNA